MVKRDMGISATGSMSCGSALSTLPPMADAWSVMSLSETYPQASDHLTASTVGTFNAPIAADAVFSFFSEIM